MGGGDSVGRTFSTAFVLAYGGFLVYYEINSDFCFENVSFTGKKGEKTRKKVIKCPY